MRFVQVWSGGGQPWDNHNNLEAEHRKLAGQWDQPIAAFLTDLKQRGLFDETLVQWCGEFGRTPVAEYPALNGRDHNHYGFTCWLAGGGVKGGTVYGATDEFGFRAVENPVHVHDLHATMLHLLGFDHERLTYRYAGRDFRFTDVHGNVVRGVCCHNDAGDLGQCNTLTVVSQLHVAGQARVRRLVFEVMTDVRKERLPRLQAVRHRDSFVQAKVRHVRTSTQRIKDQDVQTCQQFEAFVRDLIRVGTVSDVADAKSQHLKAGTVEQANRLNPRAENFERIGRNLPKHERRNGSHVRLLTIREGIVERMPQPPFDLRSQYSGSGCSR